MTPERIAFVQANWQQMTQLQMADEMGVSKYAVSRWMIANGLSVSKEEILRRRSISLKKHHAKTPHLHDDVIRDKYLELNIKQLARHIGKSHGYVRRRIADLGLHLPEELIEQRKQESRLKKGNVPINKGKKWDEFMSEQGQINSRATMFKKGHIPHNAKEADGAISIRKYSDGKQYKSIRVSLGVWKMLHVHMWEQANGPLPDGHILIFKDGNSLNCTLDNIECISRVEHGIRCRQQYYSLPDELKEIVTLNYKIKKQLKEHGR